MGQFTSVFTNRTRGNSTTVVAHHPAFISLPLDNLERDKFVTGIPPITGKRQCKKKFPNPSEEHKHWVLSAERKDSTKECQQIVVLRVDADLL